MLERKISIRYAKSLIKIAKDKEEIEKIKNELEKILNIFEEYNLWKIFDYPKFKLKEKKEIIENLSLSPTLRNFVLLLLNKKRISLLPVIFEEYSRISEEYLGIVRGEIISAINLTDEEKNIIKEKITGILNKKLILEEKIDKEILGGVIVKFGDTIIDGSIKGILNKFKEELRR